MATADQTASPFRAAGALPLNAGYGGRLSALAELPVHALANHYVVDGAGTIAALPPLAIGETVFLQMAGTPTFANSAKLICPNAINYVATSGDFVIARSKGDGIWQIYPLLSSSIGLQAANNLSDVANAALARINIAAQAQGDFSGMSNGTLVASAAGGALTVAVKTFAGVDPTAADPVYFYFRDNTLALGDFTRIAVTAALSVVLGSTKTLGATNGLGLRVWIAAFNNAGTVQLAAMNCSDANGIYCPMESVKFTTAVPASASKTWYSTSAIGTAAPWRFIGFCEWIALTTAGTWVTPDIVQLFGPGTPRPGTSLQKAQSTTATSDTGTAATSYTASTFTGTIQPQSTANLVSAKFIGGSLLTGANNGQARIQRSTTWLGASSCSLVPGTVGAPVISEGLDQPSSTSLLTYTLYRKSNNAATTVQCPYSNAAGDNNVIMLEELMG